MTSCGSAPGCKTRPSGQCPPTLLWNDFTGLHSSKPPPTTYRIWKPPILDAIFSQLASRFYIFRPKIFNQTFYPGVSTNHMIKHTTTLQVLEIQTRSGGIQTSVLTCHYTSLVFWDGRSVREFLKPSLHQDTRDSPWMIRFLTFWWADNKTKCYDRWVCMDIALFVVSRLLYVTCGYTAPGVSTRASCGRDSFFRQIKPGQDVNEFYTWPLLLRSSSNSVALARWTNIQHL